jgi:uncharacterized protein (TIGR00299 family) protein
VALKVAASIYHKKQGGPMESKVLYLDCPTGLAGDMLLAALCDCGADEALLQEQLKRLDLPGWSMESRQVQKNGFKARRIVFQCPDEHKHRHLSDITCLIEAAKLPPKAAALACRAFSLLAGAEAEAHGCAVKEVHFHEVGAADAILDICGTALAISYLGVTRVYCSSLPLSGGFVECAHGRLPLPAPATLNLLRGFSFYDSGLIGELITPTGAALLCALQAEQRRPAFTLQTVGSGAGNRDLPLPNIVRAFLGLSEAENFALAADEVDVLSTNIDDATGEILGYLLPLLLKAGALDACYMPLVMKKGRPAWQLQVVCLPALSEKLAELILAESSALGLRIRREQRRLLPRFSRRVIIPGGEITVKISANSIAPEYEDVARVAQESSLPFQEVYRQAQLAAQPQEEEL